MPNPEFPTCIFPYRVFKDGMYFYNIRKYQASYKNLSLEALMPLPMVFKHHATFYLIVTIRSNAVTFHDIFTQTCNPLMDFIHITSIRPCPVYHDLAP